LLWQRFLLLFLAYHLLAARTTLPLPLFNPRAAGAKHLSPNTASIWFD
jgi:hypothetical protein